jgi:hypothetical protein
VANEILIQDAGGSSLSTICFGVDASLNPAADNTNWTDDIGTDTCDVVLTLAGVANGAARISSKADLGAIRAEEYALFGCVDFTGETPTQGGTVDYYWAPSTDATAAQGNVAGGAGADADVPDGSMLGSATDDDVAKFCIFIGSLVCHDGASVQNGFVGRFSPPTRWGQLMVFNNSGDAFEDDDVENHQVLSPIVREVQ